MRPRSFVRLLRPRWSARLWRVNVHHRENMHHLETKSRWDPALSFLLSARFVR